MISLIFVLLRMISSLPPSVGYRIGGLIGAILMRVVPERRNVCQANVDACFPHLSDTEKHALVGHHFRELGIGIIETSWAWFRPQHFIKPHLHIEGLEVIERARERGEGVLLVGPHSTMTDLVAMMVFEAIGPLVITYRPQDNAKLDDMINDQRRRYGELIDVRNLRKIHKHLSQGDTVWFSPDQDLGPRGSVFAPFFGQETCTITTTARLSKSPTVRTVFVQVYRNELDYHLRFIPFRANYPEEDQISNARHLNELIEDNVMQSPAQYMWIHRRFKTRPDSQHHTLYQDRSPNS